MAMDSVRGYVQAALGVGETTRSRALELAQDLLELASRAAPAELATATSTLADELLASARANREMIVELVRAEVTAMIEGSAQLVRLADLEVLRSALSQLAGDVAGLRRQVSDLAADMGSSAPASAVSAMAASLPTPRLPGRRAAEDEVPRRQLSTEPRVPRRTPSRPGPVARRRQQALDAPAPAAPAAPAPAPAAPAVPTPTKRAAAKRATTKATAPTTAKQAPARKTAAPPKTAATRAPAAKTAAAKTAATKTAATKTAATKTAATKTAAAKTAATKTATKTTATKTAARTTRRTPATDGGATS